MYHSVPCKLDDHDSLIKWHDLLLFDRVCLIPLTTVVFRINQLYFYNCALTNLVSTAVAFLATYSGSQSKFARNSLNIAYISWKLEVQEFRFVSFQQNIPLSSSFVTKIPLVYSVLIFTNLRDSSLQFHELSFGRGKHRSILRKLPKFRNMEEINKRDTVRIVKPLSIMCQYEDYSLWYSVCIYWLQAVNDSILKRLQNKNTPRKQQHELWHASNILLNETELDVTLEEEWFVLEAETGSNIVSIWENDGTKFYTLCLIECAELCD